MTHKGRLAVVGGAGQEESVVLAMFWCGRKLIVNICDCRLIVCHFQLLMCIFAGFLV